ncbi:MAG: hypothetical protein A2Y56_05530 [Candidatus Aminicenantes bacterium RBG_13_63_10]|nr:MAG: hypothetical protein A2Y56_05530 [Candidatus Aminicenantes bacterium RBG_13_63_10]
MSGRIRTRRGLIILLILSAVPLLPPRPSPSPSHSLEGRLFAQESVPGQKPAFDYMSSYLSRNTNPLGLEEDKEIMELRAQPAIKWVIRAGWRHSLK